MGRQAVLSVLLPFLNIAVTFAISVLQEKVPDDKLKLRIYVEYGTKTTITYLTGTIGIQNASIALLSLNVENSGVTSFPELVQKRYFFHSFSSYS